MFVSLSLDWDGGEEGSGDSRRLKDDWTERIKRREALYVSLLARLVLPWSSSSPFLSVYTSTDLSYLRIYTCQLLLASLVLAKQTRSFLYVWGRNCGDRFASAMLRSHRTADQAILLPGDWFYLRCGNLFDMSHHRIKVPLLALRPRVANLVVAESSWWYGDS